MVLTRDPEGEERCVACYLCSAACPVDCISMQAAERQDGRRYAAWFRINFSRCIFCGLCAEACPTLAIQMSTDYEICTRDIMNLVYEKEDLLIDGCGKDPAYNFYRHAGIGVVNQRGGNDDENPPVDVRGLLP
jgi:NADH-quinone oxidoreductase subunit I